MRLTDEPKSLAVMKPDTSWSPEVQAVMSKALQRRSADRYQKAAQFGVALWEAVDHMPKQAPAGATQMIGAADGATSMIAPPPKTLFDSSPNMPRPEFVSAAAPVPAPGNAGPTAVKAKTSLFAGGAVALALAALAMIYVSKSMGKAGSTPPVAAEATAPSATSVIAAGGAPAQTASGPAVPAGNVAGSPVGGPPVPSGGRTTAPAPAAPPATVPPSKVDISARLPKLIEESAEDSTAARALKEAERLVPYAATSSEKIGLSLVRANSLSLAGKDKDACDIIETIKDRGAATPWAEKIAPMVKLCHQ